MPRVDQFSHVEVSLPPALTLTITVSEAGSVRVTRLSDVPGGQPQGTFTIAASAAHTFGAFSVATRFRIDSLLGHCDYVVAPREDNIFKTTVTLTDAQIKALPTTSVEIIPAQGVGRIVAVLFAAASMTWTADYSNINVAATLTLSGLTVSLLDEGSEDGACDRVSDLLADGESGISTFTPPGGGCFEATHQNTAVLLALTNADGDLTGGDAANVLKVTVWYAVLDL